MKTGKNQTASKTEKQPNKKRNSNSCQVNIQEKPKRKRRERERERKKKKRKDQMVNHNEELIFKNGQNSAEIGLAD